MNRFVKKYKEIPQTIKVSYWFVICNIFQKGLAFITIPIYTRLLTAEEYGLYSVYTTWAGIITIFASLSLSSAGFFFVGILKYKDEKDRFLSSIQGLSTTTAIIVFGICFLFYRWFYELTGLNIRLLLIMMVQEVFSTPLLYWSAKQRFEYKYVKVVVITMLSSVFTVVISLVLIYQLSDRSCSLILGAAVVRVVVGIYFYAHNLRLGKSFYDKKIWNYAISFGAALIPHYLAYSVLGSSDRIMINNICGTGEAGIYSLAYQISTGIGLLTSAVDASLNPWTFRKLQAQEYKETAKITNYIMAVYGVMLIGCISAAPEILAFIAPEEYQSAKWVMPPVILGHFYLYLAGSFMRIAFYHEKKYMITFASMFAAVFNIALNLVFIPSYGFMAAAYTTLAAYMIFACIHYMGMRIICRKNNYTRNPFDSKILLLIASAISLMSAILLLLYKNPFLRYSTICMLFILAMADKSRIQQIYEEIKGKET